LRQISDCHRSSVEMYANRIALLHHQASQRSK
jgi:hypothetical protein